MKKIRNVKLSNWRSFGKCDEPQLTDLRDFNVIIGANSSGKSNIACGIRFALGRGNDFGYVRKGGDRQIQRNDYNKRENGKIEIGFDYYDGTSISKPFNEGDNSPVPSPWFFPIGPNRVTDKLLTHKGNPESIKAAFPLIKEHAKIHFGLTIKGMPKKNDIYLSDVEDENGIPFIENGGGNVFVIYFLSEILKQLDTCYVFLLEEPEVHMHAGLQRKFLEYLLKLINEHNKQFIITTHSPIFIDRSILFQENSSVDEKKYAIFKVSKPGEYSKIENISINTLALREVIIDNLGNKPSDIFQANGVIWVEGVTDAIYIRRWLDLYQEELGESRFIEGFNYVIIPYNGHVEITNLFERDDDTGDFIKAMEVNDNRFVLMDMDRGEADGEKWKNKLRVIEAIGKKNCWITHPDAKVKNASGKEISTIEGYLPPSLKVIYNPNGSKKDQAVKFTKAMTKEVFKDVGLDLYEKITKLHSLILLWNQIEPTPDLAQGSGLVPLT